VNLSGIFLFALVLSIPVMVYLSPASWRARVAALRQRLRRDPLPSMTTEEVRFGLTLLRARAIRSARDGHPASAETARKSAAVYRRSLEVRGEEVPA
jgi:hypothetical protein